VPDFDAIIIGTGQAGPSLAFRLAGAGMKVAVVERHLVGGTCVNTGCTPTKALVASAYAARIARRAAEYGVVIGGDIGIDMRRVKARTDATTPGRLKLRWQGCRRRAWRSSSRAATRRASSSCRGAGSAVMLCGGLTPHSPDRASMRGTGSNATDNDGRSTP
jgi:succinate dehydrogenase/fumarate reductase flavoprotein subunit